MKQACWVIRVEHRSDLRPDVTGRPRNRGHASAANPGLKECAALHGNTIAA